MPVIKVYRQSRGFGTANGGFFVPLSLGLVRTVLELKAIPMIQAKARNCFQQEFLVSHHGNALGHFREKFFSDSIRIDLLERRRLELQKTSIWGSRLSLVDLATGAVLATATRKGIFSWTWLIELSSGRVSLYRLSLIHI